MFIVGTMVGKAVVVGSFVGTICHAILVKVRDGFSCVVVVSLVGPRRFVVGDFVGCSGEICRGLSFFYTSRFS